MKPNRRLFMTGIVAATATALAMGTLGAADNAGALDRSIVKAAPVVKGKKLLIKGGTIISMDPKVGDLTHGDILVEGTKIVKIGTSIDAPGAEIIDAKGRIVIPGFVDTHRHSWEGQLRRINPNSATLDEYSAATHFSFAQTYRPSDMYVGNMITALGAIDAGITTIIDNSHDSRTPEHAIAALDALDDSGIRAVFAYGAPIAGDWQRETWYDAIAAMKKERFSGQPGLLTLAMITLFDREQWAVARKLGLPVVTEVFGRDMADDVMAFQKEGLLGPDNIFNHAIDLTEEAWTAMKQAGVRVNITPRSDTQWGIASGVFGYQQALDHDMKPAFSIDNESAYSGDMFTEMRVALALQRSAAQFRKYQGDTNAPKPVTMRQLLETATINGAFVAHLDDRTGSLSEGKEADIVLINTNDISLYPSNNALGSVVNAGERSNVETVIIGGRIRKWEGKLVGVDMERLRAATETSQEYLFKATRYVPDMFSEKFELKD